MMRVRHSDGTSDFAELKHTMNEEQIAWFKAGSALNRISVRRVVKVVITIWLTPSIPLSASGCGGVSQRRYTRSWIRTSVLIYCAQYAVPGIDRRTVRPLYRHRPRGRGAQRDGYR